MIQAIHLHRTLIITVSMQLQQKFSIDKYPSWLGKMPGTIVMKIVTHRSKQRHVNYDALNGCCQKMDFLEV